MKKKLKSALKVYLVSNSIALLLLVYLFRRNNTNWTDVFNGLFELIFSKNGIIAIHLLFALLYVLFLISNYFITTYKKKGLKTAVIQFVLRAVLPVTIITYSIKLIVTHNNAEDFKYEWNFAAENTSKKSHKRYVKDAKIRGMNVYQIGRRKTIPIRDLLKTNIEWIAVIPYFYQKDENTKHLNTPDSLGIWSKRDSAFIKDINKLRLKGLAIMLKPHIWMSSGWRSNINFDVKNDWNDWFSDYRKNMIHYAKMAQKTNSELFCIGTELRSSLKEVPKKWIALIKEIKAIYKGKLTYAANWDDPFEFTEFWNELDYIGVQAYFPLTKKSNPNLTQIKRGWNKHITNLKELSAIYKKPILFTEVGYRNDIHATKTPWKWGNIFERLYLKKSDETQFLAYQALFEKLWHQDWFAGLFPWEWTSSDFPIFKKPSQNLISIWYHK